MPAAASIRNDRNLRLDKVVELTVPMYGGTYVDRLLLKPEEVLARRTGMVPE
jgi:hypothetical protein